MKWKLDPIWMNKMRPGTARQMVFIVFLLKSGLWHFVPKETLDLQWFNLAELDLCSDSVPFPFTLFLLGRGLQGQTSTIQSLVFCWVGGDDFPHRPCHDFNGDIPYTDAVAPMVISYMQMLWLQWWYPTCRCQGSNSNILYTDSVTPMLISYMQIPYRSSFCLR